MQARLIQQDCEWGGSGAIHASMQSLLNWLHTRNSGTPSRVFVLVPLSTRGRLLGLLLACTQSLTDTHKSRAGALGDPRSIHPPKVAIPLWRTTHTVHPLFLLTSKQRNFQAVLLSCLI